MSLAFATSVLSNEFLMLQQEHQALVAFAVATMNGQQAEPPYQPSGQPYCIVGESMANRTTLDKAPKGAVAVIPIKGTLMMEDQTSWSGVVYPGTKTMARWAQQADMDDAIDGVVFHVTSPGGMAMGSEHLHSSIAGLKKPNVAVYDELAASAAIFGTCGAQTILATTKSTRVGSIGTMCNFMDFSGLLEKFGIKMHEVYATKSQDKNRGMRDAMKGDYTSLIEEGLDPLNELFINTVLSSRGDKLKLDKENVTTGKVYMGEPAKKYGLIDGFGGIEAAVHSIRNTSVKNSNHKMSNKTKFVLFAATLGWQAGFESTAEGIHIQEADLTKLEDELSAGAKAKTDLATASTALEAANAKVVTLEAAATTSAATIATQTGKITELEAKVADLGKEPSGKGTTVATAADAKTGNSEQKGDHKFAGDDWAAGKAATGKQKTDYKALMGD